MHGGTLISHFKKGDFGKLSIPLPSPSIQQFVGDWHLAVEKKIETNRRTNETLETMAQAIFRDWFIDFGPVRRKLTGATDPIEIMGGLTADSTHAAELAALFPDMLNNEGAPEGWSYTTLADYADPNSETWSAHNVPERVRYVDLSNTNGVSWRTTRNWIGRTRPTGRGA